MKVKLLIKSIIGLLIVFIISALFFSKALMNECSAQGNSRSEQSTITFMKTFGGSDSDMSHSICQTSDKGFVIVGATESYSAGNSDVWLIKTDNAGNEQWNISYGSFGEDHGFSVKQTVDKGYIIVGWTESYGAGDFDIWLIKTDSQGNKQWDKTFGGSKSDKGYNVQQTSDGGFIILGDTESFGSTGIDNYGFPYIDIWLIKTDSNGDIEWSKTFGGDNNDRGRGCIECSDGGFIICGFSESFSETSNGDLWVIKTDSLGNEQWNKFFDGGGRDSGLEIQQTADKGYIVIGDKSRSYFDDCDIWLLKINPNGKKEWDRTFGGDDVDQGYSVQITSDNGYIITGTTMSYGAGGRDAWLIKTDSKGNHEWDKTFGGDNEDIFGGDWGVSVQETSDSGFVFCGHTNYYGAGDKDAWLIKTDGSGNINNKVKMEKINGSNVDEKRDVGDRENNYAYYFGIVIALIILTIIIMIKFILIYKKKIYELENKKTIEIEPKNDWKYPKTELKDHNVEIPVYLSEKTYCIKCGNQLIGNERYCVICGTEVG